MLPSDISSQSTREELIAAYMDACGYAGGDDPDAARVLIKAGNMLLARPQRSISSAARGESVELEPRVMQEQVNAAQRWLHSYTDQQAAGRSLLPDPEWRS